MNTTHLKDASNLFFLFTHSDWKEMHISSGGLEFYASKREATLAVAVADTKLSDAAGALSASIVSAHLGTFTATASVGDLVAATDPVGVLRVLDEDRVILSGYSGKVTDILVANGTLVEHRQPLITVKVDGQESK